MIQESKFLREKKCCPGKLLPTLSILWIHLWLIQLTLQWWENLGAHQCGKPQTKQSPVSPEIAGIEYRLDSRLPSKLQILSWVLSCFTMFYHTAQNHEKPRGSKRRACSRLVPAISPRYFQHQTCTARDIWRPDSPSLFWVQHLAGFTQMQSATFIFSIFSYIFHVHSGVVYYIAHSPSNFMQQCALCTENRPLVETGHRAGTWAYLFSA